MMRIAVPTNRPENVINYEGTVPSLTKVTLGKFLWGADAEILPEHTHKKGALAAARWNREKTPGKA